MAPRRHDTAGGARHTDIGRPLSLRHPIAVEAGGRIPLPDHLAWVAVVSKIMTQNRQDRAPSSTAAIPRSHRRGT